MSSELRLRKSDLFKALGYAPHPGQVLVHKSKVSRRVLACGTRWGKTTCAAMEIVYGLLEPRASTLGWVVAPTYELTQRTYLRVAHALQEKFRHRIREIVPREKCIRVTNFAGGLSELRAKSADQPAGLLGEALDFVVVDEAAQLGEDIWSNYIMPRLIDRQGWSLVISTPRGGGWFWEEYRRGQRNRDPECMSWSMPSWTNPHISAETIEAERTRIADEEFRQQFGAEFIGVEPEPCSTCKGPRPDAQEKMEAIPGTPVARCAECRLPIAPDGTCLLRDYGHGTCSGHIDYYDPSGREPGHMLAFTTQVRAAHVRKSFITYPGADSGSKR